jgi:hypothetical protein
LAYRRRKDVEAIAERLEKLTIEKNLPLSQPGPIDRVNGRWGFCFFGYSKIYPTAKARLKTAEYSHHND